MSAMPTHKHHHHLAHRAPFSLTRLRAHLREVETLGLNGYRRFNAKTAIVVPAVLGCMEFFWFANVLALFSLPAVLTGLDQGLHLGVGLANFFPTWLTQASIIAAVAWLAQTYVQLVALPVLQVSNNAQASQLEIAVETILDRLDIDTKGGLRDLRDHVDAKFAELGHGADRS